MSVIELSNNDLITELRRLRMHLAVTSNERTIMILTEAENRLTGSSNELPAKFPKKKFTKLQTKQEAFNKYYNK